MHFHYINIYDNALQIHHNIYGTCSWIIIRMAFIESVLTNLLFFYFFISHDEPFQASMLHHLLWNGLSAVQYKLTYLIVLEIQYLVSDGSFNLILLWRSLCKTVILDNMSGSALGVRVLSVIPLCHNSARLIYIWAGSLCQFFLSRNAKRQNRRSPLEIVID